MRGEFDLAGASEPLRDPAQWRRFVDTLFTTDWVVYAKPAFGGATAVLRYLGRYTHPGTPFDVERLPVVVGRQVSGEK